MAAKLGRYEIHSEIGRGGMGVVWRAHDPAIGRIVAIKTIRLAGGDRPGEDTDGQNHGPRLLREARSAGALTHPNIVAVYDIGVERGYAYLVMEHIEGQTLEDWLCRRDAPGLDGNCLRILANVAAALDYAHDRGVVHRDIKPANILLLRDGTAKVGDFGIAKRHGSGSLTQAHHIVGSPFFLAPELLRGQQASSLSDQFALAIVAFIMCTGKAPFEADTVETLFAKLLHEAPAPFATTQRPKVAEAIYRALSKDPAKRFASCGQFIAALAAAVQPEQYRASRAGTSSPSSSNRSSVIWASVAGLLMMLFLGAAAVGYWMHREPQKPDPQPQASPSAQIQQAPAAPPPLVLESQKQQQQSPSQADPVPPVVPRSAPATMAPKPARHAAAAPASNHAVPRIRVESTQSLTKLIRKVAPKYPPLAVQARIEGTVRYDAVIGADGRMLTLQVKSGHPLLIPAATEAVKQWLYQPTMVNGGPVEVATTIEVIFRLVTTR
jgi:TonB family protein